MFVWIVGKHLAKGLILKISESLYALIVERKWYFLSLKRIVNVRFNGEDIWLSQQQIAMLIVHYSLIIFNISTFPSFSKRKK